MATHDHSPTAYLGIASSLAVVATFAGGFTYSNVISLQTNPTTCHSEEFDDISTLLSIAFILFTTSLFVTIMIQIILRAYDPNVTIPNVTVSRAKNLPCIVRRLPHSMLQPHFWVQVFFFVSAVLLVAGFILLDIVLIDSGEKAVGGVGIALVGFVGICATVVGLCTRN